MAVFLNRHFDFSRTKNVTIKMKTDEERAEWFKYLSSFIHAVPEEADQFVLPHIKLRLLFIRNNDLQGLTQYEREEQDIKKFCVVNNGDLIARYPSLERYQISEELLKVNYKNKLEHYLQNIEFSDHSLSIQGTIKHKLLDDETNQNQSLTGVFVHRDTKAEKYIAPAKYENSTFTFECKFDELASAEEDLGVWDFFIESSIDSYKLRARIGNKRAAYKYSTNTMYLGHNALFVFSARPYFTMNYDNLSIDIKKHAYTEAELSYETESKDLSFIFKDKQICLPHHSKIIVNTGQSEISLPVKRIDLEPHCTKLTVNVQSLLEQLAHVKKERLIEFAINTSQNKISAKVDNQAIILGTKSVERKSMLFFNKMVEVQYKLLTSKSKFYFQY